ncbi:SDR family oxidoreductase [Oryzomonas sagensis]|uniref:SDR family oxidoreductase n=1 Tax=Oryzomonas sagensis TaxID=2603857 RepID=A0ABQ6TK63_9BACT|nr:SDR family oxidoreductase [Oryzomonas sagensis]KAB0668264.1 SDR family oxidoreductase [Oryzomonas sagensis]
MKLENKTILVTGSNRGIGKALVAALLKHPVTRIYAAARKTEDLPAFGDSRVVPLKLDITDLDLVKKAAGLAQDVDLLINNAGVATFSSVVTSEPDALKHDMEVNYLGTLNVVRSFAPVLEKRGGGAIANVISVVGLANMAAAGGYSASKAALFSATQAMRAELKAKGISVHGIFPGPIDTDMARDFDMPKTGAQETAENIIKGLLADQEDIFPDPMSAQVGELWAKDPKGLERQFSGM